MRFIADLHIHSKYSRACSKDCDLEHLTWWARRKGVTVVGTGDFTHPAWFDHLSESLVPAEPGLFRLREDLDQDVDGKLPPSLAGRQVRFMLSVEISTIYKRDDHTRKVHHLVYVPDFEAARRFNDKLGQIGNLGSDGRPILGLDSRDLLEITLECSDGAYLVPAHVWTPWFAVLGSKSGFDAVGDCYVDLANHIFALETGLSSDPEMNWRISGLDEYRLMSSSDAHSPPMLGREATVFDTDVDYFAIRRALETGDGHAGTVEFFPEEGKYHVDGHRKCGVRMEPQETRRHGGICPECGKQLTVGVLSRVEDLADRSDPVQPEGAAGYRSLVQLPLVMSEILGTGPKSKKVVGEIDTLTAALGPELEILEDVPVDAMETRWPLLAEAVTRLRRGEVIREAGYDGEYGVIRVFEPGELRRLQAVSAPGLFADSLFQHPGPAASEADVRTKRLGQTVATEDRDQAERRLLPDAVVGSDDSRSAGPVHSTGSLLGALDLDQQAAAEATDGPLLIVAGPGTGKTRTLAHRLAQLVAGHGAAPERCLAITFTRRASDELEERLAALLPETVSQPTVATFHSLGVRILREHHERVGLSARFGIADETCQLAIATEITGSERRARRLLADLSRARRTEAARGTGRSDPAGKPAAADAPGSDILNIGPGNTDHPEVGLAGTRDPELADEVARYVKALRQQDMVDFDDLVVLPVELLEGDPDLAASYRDRYHWVLVDEYQDVDSQQYRLLRQLVPPDGNLTAVGDPDQAIYGFRGADVGFFLRFQQDFPNARRVRLTRNYRSAPGILTAAQQMISPVSLVPDRVLQAVGTGAGPAAKGFVRSEDVPVGAHGAASEVAEASFVARTIDQLLGGTSFHSLDSGRVSSSGIGSGPEGLSFSDIAVLYRTDMQARAVMDAFVRSGLPFQKRSHDRLAERPGVDRVLAELTAYTPAAGELPGIVGTAVTGRLRQAAHTALEGIGDPEGAEAAEIYSAVELLEPLADRCGDDLEGFRTELALGIEVDTWDPRADRISLLTLHAAKGLEFPVVFVVGCEDGLLPLRWLGTGPDEIDDEQTAEERRLLFVGMTRAQRALYLSYAAERSRQGTTRRSGRSPFLADLDPAVYRQLSDPRARPKRRDTQLRLL